MAAASSNPWDETPARRPSAEDFGADANGRFVLADEDVDGNNNDISPVRDGKMLYADMMNRLLEAAVTSSTTMPALTVTVRFNAGTPVVDSMISPRTTRKIEDIDARDDGQGVTTVRVVDTTIPSAAGGPRATVHEGSNPSIKAEPYAESGWRGSTVTTKNAGSAADLGFTVEIF